jgi:hypothetical protein
MDIKKIVYFMISLLDEYIKPQKAQKKVNPGFITAYKFA